MNTTRTHPGASVKRTLAALKKFPMVRSVSDERSTGDGFWIHLKPGWHCALSGTHTVHEWTTKDLLETFETVIPCDSPDATCDCCTDK